MSKSVVQNIGVPPAQDGGGLAAVITSLTDAVTVSDDVHRHDALRDHPVTGEHSLLFEVLGAVLNAARTAYALILEFLDVSAVSDPVLGDSRAINLEAFLRPDAVPALAKRIEERAQIGYGLQDKLPQIVADSVVTVLTRTGINTADILTFAEHYGASDTTWNGIAAKKDFSANIFSPLVGLDPAAPVHLGHDEMAQLRLRILELLATIWQQLADNLLLDTAPSFQPSDDALTLLAHVSHLDKALNRMLRGDGLVRRLASDYDIGDVLIQPERLFGDRSHPSATWVVQGNRLCRFQHKAVVRALQLDQRVCPEPDLTLQCESLESPYHLDARVLGSRLLLLFQLRQYTPEGDLIRTWHLGSISLSALDTWSGDSISVSAGDMGVDASINFRFTSKPIWVDGGYHDVPLVLDWFGLSLGFIRLDKLLYIDLNLPGGIELNESTKVFTLSTGMKEGRGSHVLLVLENGSRLLIGQQEGGGAGPWWDGVQLEWVADARLRGPAFALCAVNDQIIINDQSSDRWAFLPFRALVSESLWKTDEVDVFRGILGSRSCRRLVSVVQLVLASDQSPATVHTDLFALAARPVITRADIPSSTADDLKTAATVATARFLANPELTAAASVVQAVTEADIPGSTADDLRAAASATAEMLNPAPTAEKTAAYDAAKAVSDAAQAVDITSKVGVKDAVTTAADYTEGPEQTAAASVVQAVTDADITGSTADDLRAAASAAAEMLNPAPTAEETARYNAALAVSDAAQAVEITQKIGVKDAITTAATAYTAGIKQTAAASVVKGVTDIEKGLATTTELLVDETYGDTIIEVDGLLPDGTAVGGTFTYGQDVIKVIHLLHKITALYQYKAVASLNRGGMIVFTDKVGGDSLTSLRLKITKVGSTTDIRFRVVEKGEVSGMIITSKDGYEGPSGEGVGPDFNEGIVYDIDGGNGDPLISIVHSESDWLELYNCYNSPVPEHVRSFHMGTGTYGSCQIAHELWGRVLFTDTVLTTGDREPVTDLKVDLNDLELFHGGLTPATGTINIAGTKPDGSEVSAVFTYVDDGTTVGDLLNKINVAYEGRVVTTLEEGRITILDDERGLSQTSLILSSESDITLPGFVLETNPTERVLLISTRDNRIEYHAGVLSDVQLKVIEAREAASSDEDAFTVAAGSRALAGNYDIEISRLATADTRVSQQYVPTNSDFGSIVTEQSFDILVAHPTEDDPSNAVEIPIMESADTFSMTNLEVLEKIADDINTSMNTAVIAGEITADEKTVASVEVTESGLNRLVVTSGQRGEMNALQLNDPDGLLASLEVNVAAESAGTSGGYIKPASELDAQITVDGETIARGSNLVDDAVEGVSMQLLNITTKAETVTVATTTVTEKSFGTMTRG